MLDPKREVRYIQMHLHVRVLPVQNQKSDESDEYM
jgi:hypothetical protein